MRVRFSAKNIKDQGKFQWMEAVVMNAENRLNNLNWPGWLNQAWQKEYTEAGAFYPIASSLLLNNQSGGGEVVRVGDIIVQYGSGALSRLPIEDIPNWEVEWDAPSVFVASPTSEEATEVTRYPCKVWHVAPGQTWMRAEHTPTTGDVFAAYPNNLLIGGKTFRKMSYVYDGVLYVHGDTPTFLGFEPMQDAVSRWTRATFTTATPESIAARALQEVRDELIPAVELWMRRDRAEMLEHGYNTVADALHAIGMEVADVTQVLIDLLAVLPNAMDLESLVREKLEINKARTWSEPDANNQRRHLDVSPPTEPDPFDTDF